MTLKPSDAMPLLAYRIARLPDDEAFRRFGEAASRFVTAFAVVNPFLRTLHLQQQRDRSRLVTRRKQRRQW